MGIRAMALAALAACMLGLALPAAAQEDAQSESEPLWIYVDGLAAGWDNWSWADVTLGVRSTDDERPIQVEAGAWQALFLRHAPFSTSGYAQFSFWVHGGPQGGQTLSVTALGEDGEPIPDHFGRVIPSANEWMLAQVSLSALGAEDRTITGFWIQNGSDAAAPVFFVNAIGLTRADE